jgi:hypothetical protein
LIFENQNFARQKKFFFAKKDKFAKNKTTNYRRFFRDLEKARRRQKLRNRHEKPRGKTEKFHHEKLHEIKI